MGRLKVLSGREVRAILEAHGFVYARQKGSHMMMVLRLETESDDAPTGDAPTLTVPVPDHKEIAIGTLGDIIRRSQLPRKLFEA